MNVDFMSRIFFDSVVWWGGGAFINYFNIPRHLISHLPSIQTSFKKILPFCLASPKDPPAVVKKEEKTSTHPPNTHQNQSTVVLYLHFTRITNELIIACPSRHTVSYSYIKFNLINSILSYHTQYYTLNYYQLPIASFNSIQNQNNNV